jgi:predicted phage terminase large subunit-like protein
MSRDQYTVPVLNNMMAELENLTRIRSTRAAEKHLAPFIRQAWPIIEPGREYLHNWHIDLISEYLEATLTGDITRLVINMPPRYMKSIACTVMFPCWAWTRDPALRFITLSYSEKLSVKHSVDRRNIIESDWYRASWPKVKLAADQNMKAEFKNTKQGVMFATSVGGTVLGKGGDFIILDDPLSSDDAESETERDNTIRFITNTLFSRLDDPKTGRIICVMQRLHEDDPSGHFIKQGGWEHLKIPVEAPSRQRYSLPMTKKAIVRKRGELLWNEREGLKQLAEKKTAMGSYVYAGQMMQEPAPAEGGMLKRAWFDQALYGVGNADWEAVARAIAKTADSIILSVDATFKEGDDKDFVVVQVWATKRADKFLLDQFREQTGLVGTQVAIVSMVAKWGVDGHKLIEDKANGSAAIETLRSAIPGIKRIEPEGGKFSRTAASSADIEAGNVHLPWGAPFTTDNIHEATVFPKGSHDDTLDAMTQAIIFQNKRSGILDFYRDEAERLQAAKARADKWSDPPSGTTIEVPAGRPSADALLDNESAMDCEMDEQALAELAELDALDLEAARIAGEMDETDGL